jgi:hypothetical protein
VISVTNPYGLILGFLDRVHVKLLLSNAVTDILGHVTIKLMGQNGDEDNHNHVIS